MLAALAITVAWDFEGGSLGRVETVTPLHVRCHVAGQSDQDGRNRQANWYYFRVDGGAGQAVTADLVNLPGEYNYKPNRGAVTKDTLPVWSEDQRHWTHFESAEYDPAEPRLRLRFAPKSNRFWIAHVPPYGNRDLDALLASLRGPGLRVERIGRSVDGRDIPMVTITDPLVPDSRKKVVWLMFRQHAWESGSSWAAEGAMRFLMSNGPEAVRIRRGAIFRLFPMCDPDGVAGGGVRFNKHGFDLNRNWDVDNPSKMPEIAAQKKAVLDWVDSGHRLDLFLTLHNTETGEYLEGPPGDDEAFGALGGRFFELLKEHSTFAPTRPFFRGAATTTEGKPGRMTVSQGLYLARKPPAFGMEQMIARNPRLGRLPSVDDRKAFGEGLVRAAWLAVQ